MTIRYTGGGHKRSTESSISKNKFDVTATVVSGDTIQTELHLSFY